MKLANSYDEELQGCAVIVEYNERRRKRADQKCSDEKINEVAQK